MTDKVHDEEGRWTDEVRHHRIHLGLQLKDKDTRLDTSSSQMSEQMVKNVCQNNDVSGKNM